MEGSCSPAHGGDCTAGMATECHRNTALTVGAFWHHSSMRRRVHTEAKTPVLLVERGHLLPAVCPAICTGLQDFSSFWPLLDNKNMLSNLSQANHAGLYRRNFPARCRMLLTHLKFTETLKKSHLYLYTASWTAAWTPQQNRSTEYAVRQKEEKGEIVG